MTTVAHGCDSDSNLVAPARIQKPDSSRNPRKRGQKHALSQQEHAPAGRGETESWTTAPNSRVAFRSMRKAYHFDRPLVSPASLFPYLVNLPS
jgi:hypothetical protein